MKKYIFPVLLILVVLSNTTMLSAQETDTTKPVKAYKFPLKPRLVKAVKPVEGYGMLLFQGGSDLVYYGLDKFTPQYSVNILLETHARSWDKNVFSVSQVRAKFIFNALGEHDFSIGFGTGVSGYLSDKRNTDGIGWSTLMGGVIAVDFTGFNVDFTSGSTYSTMSSVEILFRAKYNYSKDKAMIFGFDVGPSWTWRSARIIDHPTDSGLEIVDRSTEAILFGVNVLATVGWAF